MEPIVSKMYPGCDKDPSGCFERYVRDRLTHMREMGMKYLKIGEFSSTYDEEFKNVKNDNPDFWWQPYAHNVGTIKDRFVYSFTLMFKDEKSAVAPAKYNEKYRTHFPKLSTIQE